VGHSRAGAARKMLLCSETGPERPRLASFANRSVSGEGRSMSRTAAAVRVVAVVLLAALAVGARGDEPLKTSDVVLFLKAGISEHTILTELRDRGFAEPLDAAREATLRQAGASETLIVAVRRAAASAPAAAEPATGRDTAAAPARGRSPEPEPAVPAGTSHGPTFSAVARSVRVPVSVLDKRGEPVLGLASEDFQISEDGQRQQVTFFSGERRPLRIALALDVSLSMADKMRQVSDALSHFIDLLEPQDEILVITFSRDVDVVQDFTSDRDLLERVFSRLQPREGTALYDAAIEAIHRVASGPAESKAVVLVTDGVDTASSASFNDLREIARHSEVPIFSLGIGGEAGLRAIFNPTGGIGRFPIPGRGRGGRGPRGGWPPGGGGGWPGGGGGQSGPVGGADGFDARPLIDLADDTGGRAAILKGLDRNTGKVDRLKEAVESIAMTLRHRYLVGYEPDASKRGWRKIKVEVDRPSVTVQARKGYYTES
jgi:VWFA-related protein